ncbi:hypothetical protein HY404_02305 [Candidatus Microgenomates bacterium]|nr:hypothetical protein [Candidatus Microgenomates bacterium]
MRKLASHLSWTPYIPTWLCVLLTIIFVLRIPTFFEPYWYGDEAISLAVGNALTKGLLLYQGIYDNKPPLLYLVAAIAGNLFWFKVILAFWHLATIYLFHRLAKILFEKNNQLVKIATVVFAILTTLPLLEGHIANGEIFMIGPIIGAFALLATGKVKTTTIFWAGVMAGTGILFKVPAALDLGAIIILFISDKKQWLNKTFFLSVGVSAPILMTIFFFAAKSALGDYITSAFLNTLGYLSSWRGEDGDFLTHNQPLVMRGLIVIITSFILFMVYQKKKISRPAFFVSLWFVFSLFGALLSERPYPHYLIQVAPSFAFLTALMVTAKTREQFLPFPLFSLLGAALIFYKFNYYAITPYYQNFVGWLAGKYDQNTYFGNFDAKTPTTYQVARFLTNNSYQEDHLFVWGDHPEIYALTKMTPATKYIVAYHVRELNKFDYVAKILAENPPRFIVTTLPSPDFPQLDALLSNHYLAVSQLDNATIWLYLKNN